MEVKVQIVLGHIFEVEASVILAHDFKGDITSKNGTQHTAQID